jgi:UDP-glucose 4,6-dehydratase
MNTVSITSVVPTADSESQASPILNRRPLVASPRYAMPMGASDAAAEGEYRPRSILLTGGAGFIGSHTVELLHARMPDVRLVVLDKLDYCAAYGNIAHLVGQPNFKWCRGDIRSKDLVDFLLRSEEVDTIMHFAASTHVDNSFNSSISFTESNVVGTHVMLEAARDYGGVRRFIHVSTDEVYGGETCFENEESVLAPTNPYACTKAAAELICRGYAKSFNMPIIITRGNNVYGPHQFPDKFIAKTCCLLSRGQRAFIHGDGSHLRNYVYVTDMAEAFYVLLLVGKAGAVYNVGSDTEKTNLQVVRDIIRVFGYENESESELIEFVKDREMNDKRYHIDSTKLHELGWAPKVKWDDGLRMTKDWYSNPENLRRWKNYHNGLVAHPSLETSVDEATMFSPR